MQPETDAKVKQILSNVIKRCGGFAWDGELDEVAKTIIQCVARDTAGRCLSITTRTEESPLPPGYRPLFADEIGHAIMREELGMEG